ncbi:MAG: hypothetical protein QOK37_2709 [Thermoanaerobaculia bacterium]|jgi:TonB family protein|nr:hypothetical protein [Thermoanaerobaculia bacterium]
MKRLAIALFFLVPAHVLTAATYEARTPRHAVVVETSSAAGGNVAFQVTITHLPSGLVVASTRISGKPEVPLEGGADPEPGQHVAITVAMMRTSVICRVRIEAGDRIVDSIESSWATEPVLSPFAQGGGPLRVGGDVKAPVIRHRVPPGYTDVARKARIAGIVILEAVIDRTGIVKDVRVIKPLPFGLSEAAMDAVRQWVFAPATRFGKPVDVVFNVTVNFKVPPPPPSAR